MESHSNNQTPKSVHLQSGYFGSENFHARMSDHIKNYQEKYLVPC